MGFASCPVTSSTNSATRGIELTVADMASPRYYFFRCHHLCHFMQNSYKTTLLLSYSKCSEWAKIIVLHFPNVSATDIWFIPVYTPQRFSLSKNAQNTHCTLSSILNATLFFLILSTFKNVYNAIHMGATAWPNSSCRHFNASLNYFFYSSFRLDLISSIDLI